MKLKEIHETVKSNMYGVIPASVLLDVNLSDSAKILYVHISANLQFTGICDKGNVYFSKLMGCHPRTIQSYMNLLLDRGYVERAVEGNRRVIKIPTNYISFIQPPKTNVQPAESDELQDWMDEMLEKWRELMDIKRGDKKDIHYPTLVERLNIFTKEEIEQAIENRAAYVKNSEWHNLPENIKHARNIDILIRDDKSLNKYLKLSNDEEIQSNSKNLKRSTIKLTVDKTNLLD